jgi:hypothetical protein
MVRVFVTCLLVSLLPFSTPAKATRISYPDKVGIGSTNGAVTTTATACGGLCDDEIFLTYTSSGPISSNLDWMSLGQTTQNLVFTLEGPGRWSYIRRGVFFSDFSAEGSAERGRIGFALSSPYTLQSPVNSRDLLLSYKQNIFSAGEFELIGVTARPTYFVVPLPAPVALLGSGLFLLGLMRARRGQRSAPASA